MSSANTTRQHVLFLPQELIHLIVEALDDDKLLTLRACSFVAYAWRNAAYSQLFAAVIVDTSPDSEHDIPAFQKFLFEHPDVRSSVRRLTFRYGQPRLDDIVDLVGQFLNLRTLTLRNMVVAPFQRPPTYLTTRLRLSFDKCSVLSVAEISWRPLFDFINVFSVLEEVHIDEPYLIQDWVGMPMVEEFGSYNSPLAQHLPVTRTETFLLRSQTGVIEDMQALDKMAASALDVNNITAIHLEGVPSMLSMRAVVVQAKNMKGLVIDMLDCFARELYVVITHRIPLLSCCVPWAVPGPGAPLINLQSCTSLQQIYFRGISTDTPFDLALFHCLRVIQTVPPPPASPIISVSFEIYANPALPASELSVKLDTWMWDLVVSALALLTNLRSLTITVQEPDQRWDSIAFSELEKAMELMMGRFGDLLERGVAVTTGLRRVDVASLSYRD